MPETSKNSTVAPERPKAQNWEAPGQALAPRDLHFLFFFWGGDLHFLTGNVEVTLAQLASYGPCFETDKRQEILLGKYECILIFQVY